MNEEIHETMYAAIIYSAKICTFFAENFIPVYGIFRIWVEKKSLVDMIDGKRKKKSSSENNYEYVLIHFFIFSDFFFLLGSDPTAVAACTLRDWQRPWAVELPAAAAPPGPRQLPSLPPPPPPQADPRVTLTSRRWPRGCSRNNEEEESCRFGGMCECGIIYSKSSFFISGRSIA